MTWRSHESALVTFKVTSVTTVWRELCSVAAGSPLALFSWDGGTDRQKAQASSQPHWTLSQPRRSFRILLTSDLFLYFPPFWEAWGAGSFRSGHTMKCLLHAVLSWPGAWPAGLPVRSQALLPCSSHACGLYAERPPAGRMCLPARLRASQGPALLSLL